MASAHFFYVEEKTDGPLMKLNFTITEWGENERLAFKITSGNFVKDYEQRWTVATIPSGSRFTFEEQVELPIRFVNFVNVFTDRGGKQYGDGLVF